MRRRQHRRQRRLQLVLSARVVAALAAPACSPSEASAPVDAQCAQVGSALLGGSPEPTFLSLSEGDRAAIVPITVRLPSLPEQATCTGAFVAPGWVLTARHCFPLATAGDVTVEGATPLALVRHDEADLALLHVASERAPLALATAADLPQVGDLALLAGMGLAEGGGVGSPRFAVERVASVDAEALTVDGEGQSGACSGDSGGPLLVRGQDGGVKIAGVLTSGSASCRGLDAYLRADAAASWVASIAGELPSPSPSCGGLDAAGRCFGARAISCDGGAVRAERCAPPLACGWSVGASGYRCVEADPCAGVTELGSCDGAVSVRCDRGGLVRTDCSACGGRCRVSHATGAAVCVTGS